MSQETMQWLNTNTLIGFTEKRGKAWHYRAEEQGEQTNHYPLAVPVEDVKERLFNWQAVEGGIHATVLGDDGVMVVNDPTRKAIIRPDTEEILGVFKSGYKIHQYDKWLLGEVSEILDDELSIGSAGLLRKGGVAFVSVEVPDTIVTPEGVAFRPHLLAATSLDGSLSTTYKRVVTNVVCDNTMSAALSEAGSSSVKVRHSRNSNLRLAELREVLEVVHTTADDFAAEVAKLTATKVSPQQFKQFTEALVPMPEKEGRGQTIAEGKRATLNKLWVHDERVAPWNGTAWGVVQAVNTAVHHEFTVQGDRAERNMLRAIGSGVEDLDAETRTVLDAVLA